MNKFPSKDWESSNKNFLCILKPNSANCLSLLEESEKNDMSLTILTGKAFVLPRILQLPFALINSLSAKMCKFIPILKV